MPEPDWTNAPLEDLEAALAQQAQELSAVAAQGPVEGEGALTLPAVDELDIELVEQASIILVQAGLLQAATAELTPELLEVLQTIADQAAPGLYDVNNEADLAEVLQGVVNGQIPVGPVAQPGAAIPGAAPGPTAGAAPAGGIPGLPPGLPPGIPGGGGGTPGL